MTRFTLSFCALIALVSVTGQAEARCVVLLHGLARTQASFALMEAALSAAMGGERKIGTTGRGIGPCYADKATRNFYERYMSGELSREDQRRLGLPWSEALARRTVRLAAPPRTSLTPRPQPTPERTASPSRRMTARWIVMLLRSLLW